ncbi:MAG: DUF2726 domain-containing protein [Rhodoferax sp.]|nr:DUF2726 domain-containing protein [Rhodoferax sp.]
MNLLEVVALLLLCAALVLRLLQRRNAWRDADAVWPFYAKKPLASAEQVLYQRLVMALPGHVVLHRVPLSGVLGVKRGFDFERWNRRIRRLHYDFLICRKDASILAAIALEGTANSKQDPLQADGIKQRASAAAGVRLLRWQAKALPDAAEIQELLGELQMPFLQGGEASANQTWWPPVSGAGSIKS